MRKMRSRVFGVVAATVLMSAGSALALTYSLSGNPKGVREAEHVMDAFSHISGYTFSEDHFFQLSTSGGNNPSLHYRFGFSSLAGGYSWASERGAMGLSGNHLVWWRDDLSPTSGHAQAVELVFKGSSGYWAFGSSAHHGCFRHLTSSSAPPSDYGFVITGHVGKPRDSGGTISLTYTYSWDPAGTATETDRIDRSSNLVNSGHVALRNGYSFSFDNSFGGPGPEPSVNLCK